MYLSEKYCIKVTQTTLVNYLHHIGISLNCEFEIFSKYVHIFYCMIE